LPHYFDHIEGNLYKRITITPFCSIKIKKNTIISSSIQKNIKSSGGAVGGTSNRRGYYRKKQRKKSVLSTVVPAPAVDPSERNGEDPIEELKGVPASEKKAAKGKSSRRNRRRRKKKGKTMEEEVSAKAPNPTRFADLRRSEKSGDAKGEEVQVRGTMGTSAASSSSEENVHVRSWFHNLSKEDKAIAVSITDPKFIGMCLNEMGCFDGPKIGECYV
jgi:hypothetical protein